MTDPSAPGPAVEPTASPPPTLTVRRKRAEDTAAGCRALAAADLDRAEALAVDHVRWRYRHSADVWLARADMLERLEAKFQARLHGGAANDSDARGRGSRS